MHPTRKSSDLSSIEKVEWKINNYYKENLKYVPVNLLNIRNQKKKFKFENKIPTWIQERECLKCKYTENFLCKSSTKYIRKPNFGE